MEASTMRSKKARQESAGERGPGRTTRFGISIDGRLLERFDAMISGMGYANRSEAIRDLMRDRLIENAWTEDNEDVVGTLTIVYSHESRELTKKLTELQHRNLVHIVSSLHVHLDAHNCLEVLVMRGRSRKVKEISDRLSGIKGVKHGRLVTSTTGSKLY